MNNIGKNCDPCQDDLVAGKEMTVLVVDDDEMILHLLNEILKTHYRVSISESPLQALEMMREHPFDILVTDVQMDEMNGIDLVRAATEVHPQLLSIVITGFATKEVAVQALKEGVFDFLEKPFSMHTVLRCLDRARKIFHTEQENRRLLIEISMANQMLERTREELEQRVEQRTAALKTVNDELAKELAHRQEIEQRIQEALDLNRKIIAASQVGIIAYRAAGECILANAASAGIFNLSRDVILGMNFRTEAIWHESGLLSLANSVLATGGEQQLEILLQQGQAAPKWLECRLASFKLEDQQHLLLVVDDVTCRKTAEAKIHHMALHDPLTGLPNRTLFFDRLSHALSRAKRYHSQVALLFIDLDGFKPINDHHGHFAGDQFLQVIAERLKKGIRESDTVARLGGDEFAAVLQDIDSRADIETVAARLGDAMCRPLFINDTDSVESTISIGIAVYPRDGDDADNLLSKADTAMYWVKRQGKGKYLFYQDMEADANPPAAAEALK